MTRRGRLVALGALVTAATCVIACRSGASAGGDWSRSYVRPGEQVWNAVLDTVTDEGFVVDEADRERGRITATGGDSRMWREALLEISVRARGEVVQVAVSGRMGNDPGADIRRLDQLVRTLLASLDEHLLGHARSAIQ